MCSIAIKTHIYTHFSLRVKIKTQEVYDHCSQRTLLFHIRQKAFLDHLVLQNTVIVFMSSIQVLFSHNFHFHL